MIADHHRDAVEQEIIDPMTGLFSTPYGSDTEKAAAALRQYVEALAEFDRPTLQAAWKDVRDNYGGKGWPSIKLIKAACWETKKGAKTPRTGGDWRVGLLEEAKKRQKDYLDGFSRGSLAATARKEGWFFDLYEHVKSASWYQAQIVVRLERQGIPISSVGSDKSRKKYRDLWDDFKLEDMCRAGVIDVPVTTSEIDDMRERARQREEGSGPRTKYVESLKVKPVLPNVQRKPDVHVQRTEHVHVQPRPQSEPLDDPFGLPPAGPEPPALEDEYADEADMDRTE